MASRSVNRVRVKILTDQRDNTLVVPRSALFRGADDQWQVFVTKGNRARKRPVEVGLINDRLAEILSGIETGERVVRTPPSSLTDGAKVAARLAAK